MGNLPMKKILLLLSISGLSISIYASDNDIGDLLKRLSDDRADLVEEKEVEEWHNSLIASGLPQEQIKENSDRILFRAVRLGHAAVLRGLKKIGIDFTAKNSEQMTAKELALSLNKKEIDRLLSVKLLSEFEAGSFKDEIEEQLVEYIKECLVPSGVPHEAILQLMSFVQINMDKIPALDEYYPKVLKGESLGHSLDSYNPQLYVHRNTILTILQPGRVAKPYHSNLSNDEEVAQLIRDYIVGDSNTTIEEVKMVFKAWPIYVDRYSNEDSDNNTLGFAISETYDAQLIGLCRNHREDTSTWATAETDADRTKFFELVSRCLVSDNKETNGRLDYYIRFSKGTSVELSSFVTPLRSQEGDSVKVGEFLWNLNSELFPRRNEVEKKISVVRLSDHENRPAQDCIEYLIKSCVAEPSLCPLVEYALSNYKGPAIDLTKIMLESGKSVHETLVLTDQAQLLSLRALFTVKEEPATQDNPKDISQGTPQPSGQPEQITIPEISQADQGPEVRFFSTTRGKLLLVGVAGIALYVLSRYLNKSEKNVNMQVR